MERASSKAPGRSRWNANQQQLQTLEGMFEQGNGNTPNKARIKDIALELSQYGQISETNVYNWFQNRKARAKRKLQHQVGRRRRLTRSNTDNNPKVNRKERAIKAEEDTDEALLASPRSKRLRTDSDHEQQQQHHLQMVSPEMAPNEAPDLGAGSSGVEEIEGVLEDHLRSHGMDFATLASDSQLPNVDHLSADLLFSDHHFHEPGSVESPNDHLKGISDDVEAWDVRNSFGESSQLPYHSSSNNDSLNFPSSLVGDKLISLAGGPVPSMDESRKLITG